jgi:hypothetical protein
MPPQVSIPVGIDVRLTGDLAQKLEEQRKKAQDAADQMRRLITESQRVGARVSPGVAATPGQLQNAQRLVDLTKNLFTTQIALGALTANITSQMVRGDMARSIGEAARVSKTLSDSLGDVAEKQKRMLQPAAAVTAQIQNQANAAQKLASIVSPSRQRPGKMARVTDEDIESVRARMRAAVEEAKKQNTDTAALISDVASGMPTEKFLRTGKGKGEGRSGAAKDLYELLGKGIQERHQQGQLGELLGKLYTPRLYTQDYRESVREDVRGTHSQSMYEAAQRREDQAIQLQMMLEPEGRKIWKEKATSRFQDMAGDAQEKERKALLERELIGGKDHLEALESQARARAELATNARKEAEVLKGLVGSEANLQRIREDVAKKLSQELSASRERGLALSSGLALMNHPLGQADLRELARNNLTNKIQDLNTKSSRNLVRLAEMGTPQGMYALENLAFAQHRDRFQNLGVRAGEVAGQRQYYESPQGQANLREMSRLSRQVAQDQKAIDWSKTVAETGRWNAYLGAAENRLQRIRDGLRPIESISTRAFAGGLGLMLGTVAVASPVHMTFLGTAIKDLAAVIGYQFIPYVAIATEKVRKLADIILNADGAAKAGVAKWIAYGTAIAGIGVVVPKVIGAIQGLLPIIRMFAAGGIPGLVVGAGVAAAGYALAKNPQLGKELMVNFSSAAKEIGELLKKLEPLFKAFGESILKTLADVAKGLEGVSKVISLYVSPVNLLLDRVGGLLPGGIKDFGEKFGKNAPGQMALFNPLEAGGWAWGQASKRFEAISQDEEGRAKQLAETTRRALAAGVEPNKIFNITGPGKITDFEDAGNAIKQLQKLMGEAKEKSSVGAAGIGGQFLGIGDIGTHYQLEALKVPGIQGDIADNTKKTADGVFDLAATLKEMQKQMEEMRANFPFGKPPVGR